jgi:hypothetical protein
MQGIFTLVRRFIVDSLKLVTGLDSMLVEPLGAECQV